jgi:hypothetical protein
MNNLHITAAWQRLLRCILALTLAAGSTTLYAKDIVSIENPWVRPSVPGQDVGAAYMTLLSTQNASLVHAESNVTKSVEIHSMTMQNGVMKMRMLEKLALTANKPYQLEPGGFHLMLFDLKKPLSAGQQIEIELTFQSSDTNSEQKVFKQKIKVPVKTPVSTESDHHSHEHHHH